VTSAYTDRPDRVHGLVIHDGKVLLVRKGRRWFAPGGPLQGQDEDLKSALRRELEADLTIKTRSIWAQGTFEEEIPGVGKRTCGFYSVWSLEGEPVPQGRFAEEARWFESNQLAATPMSSSLRVLCYSLLAQYATRTTPERA
jgi:ADP-ribose pyrophosphatase YjhB (NUDIX family)